MLSDYCVDNAATKITEKEENISAIETPFVAHFGGDVEYILSSFTDELESANKFLIAVALQKDKAEVMKIFSDWFENGKPQRDEFFKDLDLDMGRPEIEAVF
jgi:hypothetical protein